MGTERIALVTGVTSGIGEATAKLLSEQGFRVFGTKRTPGGRSASPENIELVALDVRSK